MKTLQSTSPQEVKPHLEDGAYVLAMGGASSLVPGYRITSSANASSEHLDVPFCPNAGWLKGVCKEHGTERWKKYPCKSRTCPVCGERRKERIAWRIENGIDKLSGPDGGAWQVLTFDRQIEKSKAVRIANQYIQWLNRYTKRVFVIKVEWAKVWELHKSGRLHLNIIFAPWRFIAQKVLATKWHKLGGGSVMWIERVGQGIGAEASKARKRLGRYLAKYDQMVLKGRGVCYSKGWPGLPYEVHARRQGEIDWLWIGSFSFEGIEHWYDTELGHWREVEPDSGEYARSEGETCDCFAFQRSGAKRMREKMRALKARF